MKRYILVIIAVLSIGLTQCAEKKTQDKAMDILTENEEHPYSGVRHLVLDRFGTKVHLLIIDLSGKRFQISDHRNTVSGAAQEYGAEIATNGDGWGLPGVDEGRPNSVCYSNGTPTQRRQFDTDYGGTNMRPWINVTIKNEIEFDDTDPWKLYNAVSGDRYLIKDGQFNPAIADRRTRDARTAIGQDKKDRLMLLVADGDDSKGIGLSFPELANVLLEFGCSTAINLDGGGSSAMWIKDRIVNHPNDDGINEPPVERRVINHVMIFIPEEQK